MTMPIVARAAIPIESPCRVEAAKWNGVFGLSVSVKQYVSQHKGDRTRGDSQAETAIGLHHPNNAGLLRAVAPLGLPAAPAEPPIKIRTLSLPWFVPKQEGFVAYQTIWR